MIKNVLQNTLGADVYAVISLVLFVTVFVTMLFFVMRASKQYIKRMSELPLESDDTLQEAIQQRTNSIK